MAVIGELTVNVAANTTGLSTGLTKARTIVGSFASSLSAAKVGLMGFAGAVTAVGAVVHKMIADVDQMNDLAGKLNATFGGLAGLQYTTAMTGDSFDTLSNALGNMQVRLAQVAMTGKGSAADALQRLGLNARHLVGLKTDDAFAVIAEELKNVNNAGERAALSVEIFGKAGKEILNTLKLGADGLREMKNEAAGLGLVLDSKTVDAMARWDDELQKFKQGAYGAGRGAVGKSASWTMDILTGYRQAMDGQNAISMRDGRNPLRNPWSMMPFGDAMNVFYETGLQAPGLRPGELTATPGQPYRTAADPNASSIFNKAVNDAVKAAAGAIGAGAATVGRLSGPFGAANDRVKSVFNAMQAKQDAVASYDARIAALQSSRGSISVGVNRAIDATSNEGLAYKAQMKRENEMKAVLDDQLSELRRIREAIIKGEEPPTVVSIS